MSLPRYRIVIDNCTGVANDGGTGISVKGIVDAVEISNSTADGNSGLSVSSGCQRSHFFNIVGIANEFSSSPAMNIAGSENTFDGLTAKSYNLTGAGLVVNSAGIVVTNSRIEAIETGILLNQSAGIINSVITTKGNFENHGIIVANGSSIFNCVIAVVDSSSECLHASSAVTVFYGKNTFSGSTVAVNANITQGVSATEDNQGNLTI